MKINLTIWRQSSPSEKGEFKSYQVDNVSEDMSFFEMIDMLNNSLITKGETPVAFDHDCREGICGTCGILINGRPHGPFESCTNTGACEADCPKEISIDNIIKLNQSYIKYGG